PIYKFLRYDPVNKLPLGDESYTIILNSKAAEQTVPMPLRTLFKYVNTESVTPGDEFIETLDESIDGWNSGERVVQIMTLEQEILIRENKARKEAFAEGVENGIKKGIAEGKSIGIAEGKSIGIAEGKSIGMAAANKQTASALAAKGMPIEEIAEIISLSVSEVKTLLDS
ncbi:MAG: hypothetical protein PUB09_07725, partial [Firmicutes bacterium]|nr:hypothetical protein [Bacillota bacterium]